MENVWQQRKIKKRTKKGERRRNSCLIIKKEEIIQHNKAEGKHICQFVLKSPWVWVGGGVEWIILYGNGNRLRKGLQTEQKDQEIFDLINYGENWAI